MKKLSITLVPWGEAGAALGLHSPYLHSCLLSTWLSLCLCICIIRRKSAAQGTGSFSGMACDTSGTCHTVCALQMAADVTIVFQVSGLMREIRGGFQTQDSPGLQPTGEARRECLSKCREVRLETDLGHTTARSPLWPSGDSELGRPSVSPVLSVSPREQGEEDQA